MSSKLGAEAPDFEANTTEGSIHCMGCCRRTCRVIPLIGRRRIIKRSATCL